MKEGYIELFDKFSGCQNWKFRHLFANKLKFKGSPYILPFKILRGWGESNLNPLRARQALYDVSYNPISIIFPQYFVNNIYKLQDILICIQYFQIFGQFELFETISASVSNQTQIFPIRMWMKSNTDVETAGYYPIRFSPLISC